MDWSTYLGIAVVVAVLLVLFIIWLIQSYRVLRNLQNQAEHSFWELTESNRARVQLHDLTVPSDPAAKAGHDNQLAAFEQRVQTNRRNYNSAVRELAARRTRFPAKLVQSGIKTFEFIEADLKPVGTDKPRVQF